MTKPKYEIKALAITSSLMALNVYCDIVRRKGLRINYNVLRDERGDRVSRPTRGVPALEVAIKNDNLDFILLESNPQLSMGSLFSIGMLMEVANPKALKHLQADQSLPFAQAIPDYMRKDRTLIVGTDYEGEYKKMGYRHIIDSFDEIEGIDDIVKINLERKYKIKLETGHLCR